MKVAPAKASATNQRVFKHAEHVDGNPSDHRTALTDTKKKKLS